MFEVEDLRYATLATVSRCGMVWFSEDVLSMDIIFDHFLNRLRNTSIDADGDEDRMSRLGRPTVATAKIDDAAISPSMQVGGTCTCVYVHALHNKQAYNYYTCKHMMHSRACT